MCPCVRTIWDFTFWAIPTTLCKEKLQAADHTNAHDQSARGYVPQIEESQVNGVDIEIPGAVDSNSLGI